MTRLSVFDSPLLLGFDHFERVLDRVAKTSASGYPPYNIEQTGENSLRITLAVAGFSMDDLGVSIEGQPTDRSRAYRRRRGGSRVPASRHRGPAVSSAPSCWPRESRCVAPIWTTAFCTSTCKRLVPEPVGA